MVEDLVYTASQLEQMLYVDIQRRIPIHLFTDSVTSSKQIITKTLRMMIVDSKERYYIYRLASNQKDVG